jgi:hypothetical protein
MLHGGYAVRHAVADFVIPDGQQVLIAVPAGDAEERSAHLHVTPGNLPGINRVAQIHVHES